MRILSVKDALEGSMVASVPNWLIFFFPASILVALQDAQTPFPSPWFLLASALAQHLVGGLVVLVPGMLARRRWGLVPLGVSGLSWLALGVGRGITGGWFAETFAGSDPQQGWRVLFWVGVSILWVPALVLARAQLDHRRYLLGEMDRERAMRDVEIEHSNESVEGMTAGVATALQHSIGPAITEIHSSLSAVAPTLDPAALRAITDQLVALSDEATRLVQQGSRAQREGDDTESGDGDRDAGAVQAPISAAIDFTQSRPLLTLGITALLIFGLFVPNIMVSAPGTDMAAVSVAILSSVAILGIMVRLRALLRSRVPLIGAWALITAYAFAGLIGALVFFVVNNRPVTTYELLIVGVLPVASICAGLLVPITVGIQRANAELVDEIETVQAERIALADLSDAKEERARTQLANVLHGPLHGRLAACVMALKFSSNELDPTRLAYVTESVLDHLASASRDLDALGATPPERG